MTDDNKILKEAYRMDYTLKRNYRQLSSAASPVLAFGSSPKYDLKAVGPPRSFSSHCGEYDDYCMYPQCQCECCPSMMEFENEIKPVMSIYKFDCGENNRTDLQFFEKEKRDEKESGCRFENPYRVRVTEYTDTIGRVADAIIKQNRKYPDRKTCRLLNEYRL